MSELAAVVELVERCARETADERSIDLPQDFGSATALFGSDGVFDSMGLVSLIVAVEQAIADEFRVEIALADQRAMSQKKSPFLTCASLAEYALKVIDEGR